MQDLCLALDRGSGPLTMASLVEKHFEPERLEGENIYHCSLCEADSEAERRVEVREAPDQLIVGLNRFAWDRATNRRIKLLTEVDVPEFLELPRPGGDDRTEKGVTRTEASEEATTEKEGADEAMLREVWSYRLYGVVVHSGASAHGGHYYAYVKSGEEDAEQDSELGWWLMNDENVSRSSLSQMRASMDTFKRDNPYILFYQRTDRVQKHRQVRGSVAIEEAVAQDNARHSREGRQGGHGSQGAFGGPRHGQGGGLGGGPRFII